MPSLWQLVIPIVVALMAVAVTAWVNVKIKFAPTHDVAVHDLKQIAFRIFRWAVNVGIALNVYLLILQVSSSAPVTRAVVLTIALQIASLVVALLMSVITYLSILMIKSSTKAVAILNRDVLATTESVGAIAEAMGQHIALTKILVDAKRADREVPEE